MKRHITDYTGRLPFSKKQRTKCPLPYSVSSKKRLPLLRSLAEKKVLQKQCVQALECVARYCDTQTFSQLRQCNRALRLQLEPQRAARQELCEREWLTMQTNLLCLVASGENSVHWSGQTTKWPVFWPPTCSKVGGSNLAVFCLLRYEMVAWPERDDTYTFAMTLSVELNNDLLGLYQEEYDEIFARFQKADICACLSYGCDTIPLPNCEKNWPNREQLQVSLFFRSVPIEALADIGAWIKRCGFTHNALSLPDHGDNEMIVHPPSPTQSAWESMRCRRKTAVYFYERLMETQSLTWAVNVGPWRKRPDCLLLDRLTFFDHVLAKRQLTTDDIVIALEALRMQAPMSRIPLRPTREEWLAQCDALRLYAPSLRALYHKTINGQRVVWLVNQLYVDECGIGQKKCWEEYTYPPHLVMEKEGAVEEDAPLTYRQKLDQLAFLRVEDYCTTAELLEIDEDTWNSFGCWSVEECSRWYASLHD